MEQNFMDYLLNNYIVLVIILIVGWTVVLSIGLLRFLKCVRGKPDEEKTNPFDTYNQYLIKKDSSQNGTENGEDINSDEKEILD